MKRSIILTRKNSHKFYEYDIAIAKFSSLSSFENLDLGFGIIDINDGYYEIERGDHVKVLGYPNFNERQFKNNELVTCEAPYGFESIVVDEISLENSIVMNNRTGILDYRGMSGAPVYIDGKLAGMFNAGSEDLEGNPVLLFCRIGFLARLITYHYRFLNHLS